MLGPWPGSAPVPMTVSAQCFMPHTGSPGSGGLLVALTTGLDDGATRDITSLRQHGSTAIGMVHAPTRRESSARLRADDRLPWLGGVAHRGSVRIEPPARVWSELTGASWWGAKRCSLRVVPAALAAGATIGVALPSSSSTEFVAAGHRPARPHRRRVAGGGMRRVGRSARSSSPGSSSSGWLPSCSCCSDRPSGTPRPPSTR